MTVLLENTVGCGAQIGCRFEELRSIRDYAADLTDLRLGYCLDTCHLLAAGYDVAGEDGLRRTVRDAGRVLRLKNVKVIHANDSKTPLGSRMDRHASTSAKDSSARRASAAFWRTRSCASKPFILETPVEQEGDDRRNLDTLKRLCPKSRTTTTRSN